MDRIKPIDVERARFGHSLWGYKPADVNELLERVASELETLLREMGQAQDEITRQRHEIEGYRAQESTLKEALVLAQKTADETRAAAHKQAELIVQDTLQKSDLLAHDLQAKISDLRWEVEKLRLEKQKFVKGFRAMLEDYLRELDQAEQTEAARLQIELGEDEGPSAKVI